MVETELYMLICIRIKDKIVMQENNNNNIKLRVEKTRRK